MRSDSSFPWRIVAVLFAGALAVRVITIWSTGFDGLYGQDAYAYFDQALALRAALLQGVPVPPGFHWPQGYPALVALMSLFVGSNPFAAQSVSLLMGSLAAPLTFIVGRRLLPSGFDGAAIFAAVLITIGGQAVLSSIVNMSDATAGALILLSMWTVLEYANAPNRRLLLVLAVVLGGTAVATRWAFVLVGPALAVPALVGLAKCYPRRRVIFIVGTACTGFGALLVVLLGATRFDFSGYFQAWRLLNALWGPIPEIPADSLAAKAPGLLYYLAPIYHPGFIGPLLCPIAFFGLWQLWKTHDRWASTTLILWAGVPLMFFVGLPIRSLRFCLTNAVPFVLVAGYGAWILLRKPGVSTVVRLVIALSCVGIIGWGAQRIADFTGGVRSIVLTAQSVEALLPDNALVLAFDITLVLKHETTIETIELFDQDAASLQSLIDSDRPLFLLTQPDDVFNRWKEHAPGINTRWLEDHGSLVEICSWGPYTLRRFHVRTPQSIDLNTAVTVS